MPRLRFRISMSLDGFVAGPHQSVENPLGMGGERLHQWAFALRVWRAMHGLEGGEVNESNRVAEESLANIGATIMGRNMFGGHPGPWDPRKPWNAWWGENPPFHHPVFVLTHHAREPLVLQGGNTFTFVTDGIESALEQAVRAAGGRDVSLAGGAKAAQQYLAAGLVDEMEISVVPTLLGSGERLFEGTGDDLHGLELVRMVAAPGVTHLKFARRRPGLPGGPGTRQERSPFMKDNVLERLFEHNNWANLRLIEACAALTDAQLDAPPQPPSTRSIRQILTHLASAQQSYLSLLTLPVEARRSEPPAFADLAGAVTASGEGLLAIARGGSGARPAAQLRTKDGYLVEPWVVMAQVINHATVHREQICGMLRAMGVTPPSFDGWDYGEAVNALAPAPP